MADWNPEVFSSGRSIVLEDSVPSFRWRRDSSRWTGRGTPRYLAYLEPLIRARGVEILNPFPVDETFDRVDRVTMDPRR